MLRNFRNFQLNRQQKAYIWYIYSFITCHLHSRAEVMSLSLDKMLNESYWRFLRYLKVNYSQRFPFHLGNSLTCLHDDLCYWKRKRISNVLESIYSIYQTKFTGFKLWLKSLPMICFADNQSVYKSYSNIRYTK